MSNLTTQDLSSLTMTQQKFVSLRQGFKSVKDLDKGILKAECAKILVKASFEMGSPMANDAMTLQFQTNALFNELESKYSVLTLPELYEAFSRGIRGESGQFFGMCPKTYHQFIKWFYELPERQKSWVDFLAAQDQLKIAEKPTQNKIEISKERCKQAFETYKLKGEMPLVPAAYYDLINEWIGEVYNGNKTLVTDPESRRAIVEDVKSRFEKICIGQKIKSERSGNHESAEKLINLVMDPKGNKTLERMTKEAFLKHFFNTLIKNNLKLEL